MKKTSVKILFSLFSFLLPIVSFAQVEITEIMYEPEGTDNQSGGEWIEVFVLEGNIDITSFKISDKTGTDGKFISRPIKSENGFSEISSGEYAIIAKDPDAFNLFFPLYSGNLFSSAISLTEEDEITLIDSLGAGIDNVSFSSLLGAQGDGNSLQKINSDWIAADPTPGEANSASNSSSSAESGSSNSSNNTNSSDYSSNISSGSGSSSLTRVSTPGRKLEIYAGEDRAATPGSPIWFQATVKKNTASNSELDFHWSFGDGKVGTGNLVSHTYKYPGDYVVVLSANTGNFISTSRLKVKVADPSISVSAGDSFVEITNNTDSEINLFRWRLENQGKGFIFQPNTIILPKSSIKIEKDLFTLKGGNNSDGICLKDSFGQQIFSVANIDNLQKEAYSLVEKAVTAGLVLEKSPVAKMSQVASPAAASAPTLATSSDPENVIYEVPKEQGLLSKLTNFVKRVFSK